MNLNTILIFVISLLFVIDSQSLPVKQLTPLLFTVESAGENKLTVTTQWDGTENKDNRIFRISISFLFYTLKK